MGYTFYACLHRAIQLVELLLFCLRLFFNQKKNCYLSTEQMKFLKFVLILDLPRLFLLN